MTQESIYRKEMTQTTANFSSETRKSEVKIKKNFFQLTAKMPFRKKAKCQKKISRGEKNYARKCELSRIKENMISIRANVKRIM